MLLSPQTPTLPTPSYELRRPEEKGVSAGLSLASDVGDRDQCVLVFTLDRSKNLHRPCPCMGHQFNHFLLCRRTLAIHIVHARIDQLGVVGMLV
jgi:hypothetical protein